nr:la-related protein 1C-like isoform X1 [Tanacetum cinerariifolium]
GDKLRRRNEWGKWLQLADFPSIQSPPEANNDLPEEASMQKLTLVEATNLDAVDNVDQKEVQELTFSSELASEHMDFGKLLFALKMVLTF